MPWLRLVLIIQGIIVIVLNMVLPTLDITSDYIAAHKFFNPINHRIEGLNETMVEEIEPDSYWGALTIFFTFLPAILSFVTVIRGKKSMWKDVNLAIAPLVLPIVELIVLAIGSREILKHNAKVFLSNVELSKTTDPVRQQELKKQRQKHQAQAQNDKSTLQIFKIFQCIGESGPQSVLLTSIQMKKATYLSQAWSYLLQDFYHSPWTSTLVTITLSLLSLVFTSGSLLVESGFVIQGMMITPYHSLFQNLVQTTLMVLVVLPRVLTIGFVFASFDGWTAMIPATIGSMVYIVSSCILLSFYKRKHNLKGEDMAKAMKTLIITSVLMPCTIINPRWNLLTYFSLTSASVLSMTLTSLGLISLFQPELLKESMIQDVGLYQVLCVILIGLLLISSAITAFQVYLVRRNHQTFYYHCILNEPEAIESIFKTSETLNNEQDFNEMDYEGWNGLHYASNNGFTQVVKLIMANGQSVDFEFNATDDDGNTAYILACKKPSIPAIVELFRTNAETNGIDLNIKNKLGNTGDFYLNNQ